MYICIGCTCTCTMHNCYLQNFKRLKVYTYMYKCTKCMLLNFFMVFTCTCTIYTYCTDIYMYLCLYTPVAVIKWMSLYTIETCCSVFIVENMTKYNVVHWLTLYGVTPRHLYLWCHTSHSLYYLWHEVGKPSVPWHDSWVTLYFFLLS